jgi:ketosteroid isomerase-like protein
VNTLRAELFGDIDRMDAHAWAAHLATDAVLRFANADPVHGREACEGVLSRMLDRLVSINHDRLEQWKHGDATIVEANVTCRRPGGKAVTMPMVTIYRENARHQISDYRVYIDTTPIRG